MKKVHTKKIHRDKEVQRSEEKEAIMSSSFSAQSGMII
jgi:hypothetical protein